MLETLIIITHASQAHMDEVFACAVLVCKFPAEKVIIKRVNTFDNEKFKYFCWKKDTEKVFVVDIGGRFDNELHFDHHQDEENVKNECATTLVVKKFMLEIMEDDDWSKYIESINYVDNNGGTRFFKDFAKVDKYLGYLLSLNNGIVDFFKDEPETVAIFLSKIIKKKLETIKKVKELEIKVRMNTFVRNIEGMNILFLNKHHDEIEKDLDINILNKIINKLIRDYPYTIHASLTYDPRDENKKRRSLYRFPRAEDELDFNLAIEKNILKEEDITFCHKKGFILNFSSEDIDNVLKEIIKGSKKC